MTKFQDGHLHIFKSHGGHDRFDGVRHSDNLRYVDGYKSSQLYDRFDRPIQLFLMSEWKSIGH